MLKSIAKYKKLKDVINIKETEVWLSLLLAFCLCAIFRFLDLYNEFSTFLSTIEGIINCFIGGFLGIIGFALSGMALMLGLFNKKQIDVIEKINGKGVIEKIMSSYAFLAFISAINIFVLLIILFVISSKMPIIPEFVFWILVYFIIYVLLFNMFYAVALVFNCISLFVIYKSYTLKETENVLPIANEVRIDFMIGIIAKVCQISREEVLKQLENEASNLPSETRQMLKNYYENHYPKEDSENIL